VAQVTKRMPYVQWLVEAVVDRITPAERQERNAPTQQPSQVLPRPRCRE